MCAVHVTILGLLARSSDFYAERGSEVRALKSADGPNPNFAPNICTCTLYGVVVGPDKPAIPGQWLYYISSLLALISRE